MGKIKIEEFLTYLAVQKHIAQTAQNQAFLGIDLTNKTYKH